MGLMHRGLSILNNYSIIWSTGLEKYLNSTLLVGQKWSALRGLHSRWVYYILEHSYMLACEGYLPNGQGGIQIFFEPCHYSHCNLEMTYFTRLAAFRTVHVWHKQIIWCLIKVTFEQDSWWGTVYPGCNPFRNTFPEICCRGMDKGKGHE